jgi:hypothetical protein
MELELSTSPRHTWVWAHDIEGAQRLCDILTEAGCSVSDATGTQSEPRVFDIDIGVDAMGGLGALRNAGHSFRWHATQHELNREPIFCGFPVAGARSA